VRAACRVLIGILALGCDSDYHTHISEIEGPDSIAEPSAHGSSHWRTARAGSGTLRSLACVGDEAMAVGDGGVLVRIDAHDHVAISKPLAGDLYAVASAPAGPIAGGNEGVWQLRAAQWSPLTLPHPARVRSIAVSRTGQVLVAGLVEGAGGPVGWAAEQTPTGFAERRLDWIPQVFQALSRRDGTFLLAIDSTPVTFSMRPVLVQLLPAQDVHPRILALDETGRGLVAAGEDTAWTIENGRLVRELRQPAMRLTSVVSLGADRAVTVGRVANPGGRAGGVAWSRDRRGTWRRELVVPDQALLAVVRCGGRVVAVGEDGLVAFRN
jgi:hypothetical protein